MTEDRGRESGTRDRKPGIRRFCFLIPVFCLLLSACGFSPIYGPHGNAAPVTKALGNVAIANMPDRQGQQLRNHLIDRMYFSGRPERPDATLDVTLRSTETDLGIQKDATASRRELNMWADYTLRDNDGKQLLKGRAHSVVSFSKLSAQYGTLAAEQNATDRALKEVGEQIVNRLSLYYAEKS
jgi:LPS-assembly lipoprotein